ncbi:response regulator transcription factor [Actinomadura barringtoniae]|uniref:Response regulator transcription factor n=1 Tax=Actinomadura barringtoniae TaxID=1427535 RepID=A0A939T7H2_9ACTN|nr:response regulator transcription factor [Actinomadura barringtoniae]MBO2449287.1 response regulator transcription factor [Actinomadura barringtoniae]
MARILVVEDDLEVRTALVRDLTDRHHSVRSVGEAWTALREVSENPPEAVILDLGLPDLDGFELLKMLRGISTIPVLVVTARDGERDIVRLLNAGADDYLVKPFSVEELEARLGAVLRRAQGGGGESTVFTVGGLRIDLVRHEAFMNDQAIDLSRREFDLLAYLAARPGEVVSRSELRAEVWRQPYGNDQTVDVHLSWLRRKLGETASAPRYLHTVRGVGIKLEVPQ